MKRKAALVGCREGQWVHTHSMNSLRLRAKVRSETLLEVTFRAIDGRESTIMIVGPGIHRLRDSIWTRVRIVDGPHEDALCLLEGAA